MEYAIATINILVLSVLSMYTYSNGLSTFFSIAVSFLAINLYIFIDMFILGNYNPSYNKNSDI